MQTTHYRCLACLSIFEHHEALVNVSREPFEFWGQIGTDAAGHLMCPECGGEDLDQAFLCDACHEHEVGEGLDQCETCFAKVEAEQEANVARIKELSAALAAPEGVHS